MKYESTIHRVIIHRISIGTPILPSASLPPALRFVAGYWLRVYVIATTLISTFKPNVPLIDLRERIAIAAHDLCIGPEPSPRRLASPQAGKSINEWGR
jgi:hypothetical protein